MASTAVEGTAGYRIEAIAEYHDDVDRALRFYFSSASPTLSTRFLGLRPEEIQAELRTRLEETDRRSAFFVLTSLEASFYADYKYRCRKKLKDPLSKAFHKMYKAQKDKVRLDEDVFETWREYWPGLRPLIGRLRDAFRFRHWLAHGRHRLKPGGKYDFSSVYSLAELVLNNFPLQKLT